MGTDLDQWDPIVPMTYSKRPSDVHGLDAFLNSSLGRSLVKLTLGQGEGSVQVQDRDASGFDLDH